MAGISDGYPIKRQEPALLVESPKLVVDDVDDQGVDCDLIADGQRALDGIG